MPDEMHCPACGKANEETLDFCLSCGAVLPSAPDGGVRRRLPVTWRQVGFYLLALAIAIIMPIAGLIVGIIYACRREDDERNLGIFAVVISVIAAVVQIVVIL